MSDDLVLHLVNVLGLGLIVASFGYAAYWGLAIRRGLVMRAYRNQAVGLSAVSLYFLLFIIQGAFRVDLSTPGYLVTVSALFDLGMLATVMLWINTTVTVA